MASVLATVTEETSRPPTTQGVALATALPWRITAEETQADVGSIVITTYLEKRIGTDRTGSESWTDADVSTDSEAALEAFAAAGAINDPPGA